MSSKSDPSVQWDRVARELRACKESQEKAWGDVDSTTLGRYLAGEASRNEQSEIEQALAALPDLRALTDLVRDVLNDPRPAAIAAPGSEPVHLPLPTKVYPASPGRFASPFHLRSSLVAAACLLLVFGLGMPQSGFLSAPRTDSMPRLERAVAMRTGATRAGLALVRDARGISELPESMPRSAPPAAPSAVRRFSANLPPPRTVDSPPPTAAASPPDPQSISPRKAAELNRMAFQYTANGQLAQAVTPLRQAHWMFREKLGPNHPTTQKTARYLANVYQVALNAAPTPSCTGQGFRAQAFYHAALTLGEQIAEQPARDVQKMVVPVLAQALRTAPTARERLGMVKALASLGPAARTALPELTACLKKSHDPVEVKEVERALAEIGPAARDALPTLACLECPEARCGIDDRAGCFTVQALRRSTRLIRALAQRKHVEILFETVQPESTTAKTVKFVRRVDRLRAMGARAIHVVFTPNGKVFEVHVSDVLRRDGITAEKVCKRLRERCRGKSLDRALDESIHLVAEVAAKK